MRGYYTKTYVLSNGDTGVLFVPKYQRPNKYGLVVAHGANGTGLVSKAHGGVQSNYAAIIAELCQTHGITCIATDLKGPLTFGNSTEQAAFDLCRTELAANGCRSDGVVGFGVSMGNLSMAQYAANNTGKLKAAVGCLPACDIVELYNDDVLGQRANIGIAWGVTYPTALPSAAPITTGSAAAASIASQGIPWKLLYVNDSSYTPPGDSAIQSQTVVDFATAIGAATPTVLSTTGGHNDAALANIDVANVAAFLLAAGA
jgi:hypothetical protein